MNDLYTEVQEMWSDEFPEIWAVLGPLAGLPALVTEIETDLGEIGKWTEIDKTANFVANGPSWSMYICNTSGGAFACDLPANPADGRSIGISRIGNKKLTLVPNGSDTINGVNKAAVLPNRSTLILVALASGWRSI
jgi:hypothetical protein